MRNPCIALDPMRNTQAAAFAKTLHRNIIGQNQAIEGVSQIYQTFRVGLNAPGRPVGNLLFLGPTGSGKTVMRFHDQAV